MAEGGVDSAARPRDLWPWYKEVSPTDKLPAASIRKLAQDQVTSTITGKEAEVSLCGAAVEGLVFLL